MPAAIPSIIGAGATLLGGRSQRRAQNSALAASQTELFPFNVSGLGGAGASFDGSNVNFNAGDLGPLRQALLGTAGNALGSISTGLPGNVQGANSLFQNALGGAASSAFGGLDALESTAGNALANTFGQFGSRLGQGFQSGLQNSAFGVAGTQLADLNQTGAQARDASLSNFRAQAQPANERAVNSQLNNLFGSGRLGTTGGANVVGRLAEAQNQQDLGFQQAAFGEGRAAQQNALGLAQGASGIGSGLAQQQEGLLNSAFGRFAQTQGLAAGLSNQRFNQASGLAQLFGNNLSQQGGLAQLQQGLRGGDLGFALQALQGQAGIQDQLQGLFGQGLQANQAAANARVGSGTNVAAIASNPNFGSSPLQGLGGAILGNTEGIGNFFGNLFNR